MGEIRNVIVATVDPEQKTSMSVDFLDTDDELSVVVLEPRTTSDAPPPCEQEGSGVYYGFNSWFDERLPSRPCTFLQQGWRQAGGYWELPEGISSCRIIGNFKRVPEHEPYTGRTIYDEAWEKAAVEHRYDGYFHFADVGTVHFRGFKSLVIQGESSMSNVTSKLVHMDGLAVTTVECTDIEPLSLEFEYTGTGKVTINEVKFTGMKLNGVSHPLPYEADDGKRDLVSIGFREYDGKSIVLDPDNPSYSMPVRLIVELLPVPAGVAWTCDNKPQLEIEWTYSAEESNQFGGDGSSTFDLVKG